MTGDDWFDHALCIGRDPAIFFPIRGESNAQAKEICGRCPVESECLRYAIRNGIEHGVWGGTSERQRRKLRKIWRLTLTS